MLWVGHGSSVILGSAYVLDLVYVHTCTYRDAIWVLGSVCSPISIFAFFTILMYTPFVSDCFRTTIARLLQQPHMCLFLALASTLIFKKTIGFHVFPLKPPLPSKSEGDCGVIVTRSAFKRLLSLNPTPICSNAMIRERTCATQERGHPHARIFNSFIT